MEADDSPLLKESKGVDCKRPHANRTNKCAVSEGPCSIDELFLTVDAATTSFTEATPPSLDLPDALAGDFNRVYVSLRVSFKLGFELNKNLIIGGGHPRITLLIILATLF